MTFLDAVKAFEDDLKAKVNIPVHNKNIPTDSVSMRVALNNADADGLFLNSEARVMTGQFNVEISAQLDDSKYQMMNYANMVLDVFVRGYSVPVLDRRVLILQANQSTPYPTEAHQKINVIIDFQITKISAPTPILPLWTLAYDGISVYGQLLSDWQPTGDNWEIKVNPYLRALATNKMLFGASASSNDYAYMSGSPTYYWRYNLGGAGEQSGNITPDIGINVIHVVKNGMIEEVTQNGVTTPINIGVNQVNIGYIGRYKSGLFWQGQIHRIELIDNTTPSNSIVINNLIQSETQPTDFNIYNELTGAVIGQYYNGVYELAEGI